MTDPTAPTSDHRVVVDLAEGLATSHNNPATRAEAIAVTAQHLLANRHALTERLDELGSASASQETCSRQRRRSDTGRRLDHVFDERSTST